MITPNELRIGNCIWHERIGNPCKWVNHRVINDIASNPYNHEYSGIEITEEWLLRFGITGENSEYSIPANFDTYYAVLSPNNLWTLYISGIVDVNAGHQVIGLIPISDTFKYVHQLQNLYFALTGQELEINK